MTKETKETTASQSTTETPNMTSPAFIAGILMMCIVGTLIFVSGIGEIRITFLLLFLTIWLGARNPVAPIAVGVAIALTFLTYLLISHLEDGTGHLVGSIALGMATGMLTQDILTRGLRIKQQHDGGPNAG